VSGPHDSRNEGTTDSWITPKWVTEALGPFDLDPCADSAQPWMHAMTQYMVQDDGLVLPWAGRVWLNPPYGGDMRGWLGKMADHDNGMALISPRTSTRWFQQFVLGAAWACLWVTPRIKFCAVDGTPSTRPVGDNVIAAYGAGAFLKLLTAARAGKIGGFITLRGMMLHENKEAKK
jgi:hypothetical protein